MTAIPHVSDQRAGWILQAIDELPRLSAGWASMGATEQDYWRFRWRLMLLVHLDNLCWDLLRRRRVRAEPVDITIVRAALAEAEPLIESLGFDTPEWDGE